QRLSRRADAPDPPPASAGGGRAPAPARPHGARRRRTRRGRSERTGVAVPDPSEACTDQAQGQARRSEEHTSELQSRENLVCRLLLEKKKKHIHSSKFNKECHMHSENDTSSLERIIWYAVHDTGEEKAHERRVSGQAIKNRFYSEISV